MLEPYERLLDMLPAYYYETYITKDPDHLIEQWLVDSLREHFHVLHPDYDELYAVLDEVADRRAKLGAKRRAPGTRMDISTLKRITRLRRWEEAVQERMTTLSCLDGIVERKIQEDEAVERMEMERLQDHMDGPEVKEGNSYVRCGGQHLLGPL